MDGDQVIAPSTALFDRVADLVACPTARPLYPAGEPMPEEGKCWKCWRNQATSAHADLCSHCRAWLRGDTDEEPPVATGTVFYRQQISRIVGHMTELGVYQMPEGDQRGVW